MAIENDIVALLHTPEVQKIRFVAEAVRIGGDRYKAVAHKLKAGLITVEIDPDLDDDDDNPRDGKYNPRTDTVTLMKDALVTTDDKRIAVHEMTHAVIDNMDLPRSRGLSHYEAEGIAYIAAALYIRFVGGPAVDDTDDPHVQVADAIAKNVIAAGHGTYVVTPHEMRKLRRAIGKDPLYGAHTDHPQFSDGRARFRLGLQRLKRRGFAIEWLEREGWWASVFMVRGHPLLIAKLQRISGHIARRPSALRGRSLDIVV